CILWGVVCAVVILFFFQAEDGIRDRNVTGVQTCALPIWMNTKTAITLIEDRRNSTTPKEPTLARLITMISAAKSRIPAQMGIDGTQYARNAAQATSSAPVTQTVTHQYSQRERDPQDGERQWAGRGRKPARAGGRE